MDLHLYKNRIGKREEFLQMIQARTASVCQGFIGRPNTDGLIEQMRASLSQLMNEMIVLDYIDPGYSFGLGNPYVADPRKPWDVDTGTIDILFIDKSGREITFEELLIREGYEDR